MQQLEQTRTLCQEKETSFRAAQLAWSRPKPISADELLARLRMALRRARCDHQKTSEEASAYINGGRCIFFTGLHVKLRKKLETTPDQPQYIQTHIGIGYPILNIK